MRYSSRPAVRALLVLSFLLGLAASAFGSPETGDQGRGITLQEAVSRALANNPGIKAARIDVDVQHARRDHDARPTPYTLQAEVENFAGTGNASEFDLAETTIQLSKVLELGDKRQHRVDIGDAQASLAQAGATAHASKLAAEVSRRYVDLLKRQERLNLSAESIEISSRALSIVERRAAVGRASEAEKSTAIVSRRQIQLVSERLGSELEAARVNLAVLWGSIAPDFTRVEGDVYSMPPLAPFAELDARLAESPQLVKNARMSQIQEAKRRLAASKRRPDLQLSAGLRHLAGPDDTALVFSFSMPIGSHTRADPLVRGADLESAKTSLTNEERSLELRAALFELYQSLLASRNELDTLRQHIIPEARRAVQFYERGFELGTYSLLELTAAQDRLLTLRSQALEATATYHLTIIEIESVLGNANPGGALK